MKNQEEFIKRYKYNPAQDRLGEGGFGEVFKAYDTFLDRWVALKVSKVKADFPELRLKNEVELINKLPIHPNIARYEECYTFSTLSGDYDFGILQYYESGNLLQLLKNQTLSIGQKYDLLIHLLEGVRFIHEQNIVHRDLKPQNILIAKRENNFIPKITDFGISKKVKSIKENQFSNSLIGAGTIAYAAPEQLADKQIQKNADLWSFGVIAYQVLSGELPFNSGPHSTSSELGRQEILRQINSGQLPLFTDKILPPWKTVIERCLVKDPKLRVKDANECFVILENKKLSSFDGYKNVRSIQEEDDYTQIGSCANNTEQSGVRIKKRKQLWYVVTPLLILFVALAIFLSNRSTTNRKQNVTVDPNMPLSQSNASAIEPVDSVLLTNKSGLKTDSLLPVQGSINQNQQIAIKNSTKSTIKQEAGVLTFPNGDTYKGLVKDGKMNGKGIYFFKNRAIISKNDPMERIAEAGDYIEGDWVDGELYIGSHFDRNGRKLERIVIGRN